eukprot:Colp12_sorted_trinity150504_noHs@25687
MIPRLLLVLGVLCLGAFAQTRTPLNSIKSTQWLGDEFPEKGKDTIGIAQVYGYPIETHKLQTPDGYILTTFRIPHSKNNTVIGKPVLVGHGILDSSDGWLLNGEEDSLAFILSQAGYDVWLMNIRGNSYSREHVSLTTNDKAYWQFTIDQLALYDWPTNVEYVLNHTGADKLSYIGHSQGGTQVLASLSTYRPDLAEKLHVFVGLAAVSFLTNTKSLLLKALVTVHADTLVRTLGLSEFLPSNPLFKLILPVLCTISNTLCASVVYLLCGYDQDDFNKDRWAIYMEHFPAGASMADISHWATFIRENGFGSFDWGDKETNLRLTGFATPVQYDISKIKADMALFWGGKDVLGDDTDTRHLVAGLTGARVATQYDCDFAHLDYTWGKRASSRVYQRVLEVLAQATAGAFNPIDTTSKTC